MSGSEAVYEVCQACNVTEREVFAALIANDPSDQLCVAYHLIIDNKSKGRAEITLLEVVYARLAVTSQEFTDRVLGTSQAPFWNVD
ncbi:hypothetical protein ACTXT7_008891 [Hymenolepis weldensis]